MFVFNKLVSKSKIIVPSNEGLQLVVEGTIFHSEDRSLLVRLREFVTKYGKYALGIVEPPEQILEEMELLSHELEGFFIGGGNFNDFDVAAAGKMSVEVPALEPGKTYYFLAIVVSKNQDIYFSNIVSATAQAAAPQILVDMVHQAFAVRYAGATAPEELGVVCEYAGERKSVVVFPGDDVESYGIVEFYPPAYENPVDGFDEILMWPYARVGETTVSGDKLRLPPPGK